MKYLFIFLLVLSLFSCNNSENKKQTITIFAGSASKPPTDEIIKVFEQKTGIKVDIIYGGSGTVLAQMKLSKQGDIYFPGSSDFMEKAKKQNLVYAETEQIAVYLVSAINVQKGNPKNIKSLKDLLKPNLRIAIAAPENVCVGTYAVEIIEKNFNENEKELFRKNLVNYTESCDKTASAIALKSVDAVIGWSVFQYWNSAEIETIPLNANELVRIGYIPIAISKFTKNKENAQKFIDFLMSEDGKMIFRKFNYFANPNEAKNYIGTEKPIGGEYILPKTWIEN